MATNLLLPPLTTKLTKTSGNRRRGSQLPPTKKISPTYISSDLHSPEQQQRITIPFLGVQSQEAKVVGGKSWGENATSYGGIGKLSFLGKPRANELYVSRGQKHFSGALSKYENQLQPYMLTAFKYSGCRQNDQVLPPCFKVGLNPHGLKVFDGSPIIPYFSHNCKHEVFPRNDPNRLDSSGKPVLSERTRDSLEEMYRDLYEEPFYNKTFPNHFKTTDEDENMFRPEHKKETLQQELNSNNGKPNYQIKHSTYNINPTLARLCFLSSKTQPHGKMAPLKILLLNYLDHPSVFSEFRCDELYRVLKDLQLFSSSDSAKHLGINLDDYPFQRLVDILESEAIDTEKLLLLREALGFLPQSTCGTHDAQNSEKDANRDNCNSREVCSNKTDETKGNNGINCGGNTTGQFNADQCNVTLPSWISDVKDKYHSYPGLLPSKSKQPLVSSRECIPGTSPCWPPSKSYCMDLRTIQLRCPTQLTHGQCAGNCDSTIGGKVTPHTDSSNTESSASQNVPFQWDPTTNDPNNSVGGYNSQMFADTQKDNIHSAEIETKGLNEYKQYLESFLPSSFDTRGRVNETRPFTVMIPPSTDSNLNKAHYVGYDKLGRKTYLPPVSLTECLEHNGDRVPDRLGLDFKTEAHKRFHAMYPDSVPDLRNNKNYRKRYFFSGYHTSVFRG